jgi:peptidyl-tRNA hydrolase
MFQPVEDGEDSFKLALIVRTDLKMGKGKAAAQVWHVECEMVQY